MSTELQRTISGLWKEVLEVQSVGPDENFFDLGGNSRRMMQFHSKLQAALGTSIPIMKLFEHTTVRSLAASLDSNEGAARSYQRLMQGKLSNPFRPGATANGNPFEERARKQLEARRL